MSIPTKRHPYRHHHVIVVNPCSWLCALSPLSARRLERYVLSIAVCPHRSPSFCPVRTPTEAFLLPLPYLSSFCLLRGRFISAVLYGNRHSFTASTARRLRSPVLN